VFEQIRSVSQTIVSDVGSGTVVDIELPDSLSLDSTRPITVNVDQTEQLTMKRQGTAPPGPPTLSAEAIFMESLRAEARYGQFPCG
jgi:hypothetical protein